VEVRVDDGSGKRAKRTALEVPPAAPGKVPKGPEDPGDQR